MRPCSIQLNVCPADCSIMRITNKVDFVNLMFSLLSSFNEILWSWFFLPCVILCGGLLTIRCGALQFRRFGFAMKATVGKAFHQAEDSHNTVTPLQAASTALASTVGTGNIVGTAQAICMGGPGAVFWLWVAALFGMIIKYAEIYLSLLYRNKSESGEYIGGPMYYIEKGLGNRFAPLAASYAVFAAISALGMGNMSQMNSLSASVTSAINEFTALNTRQECLLRLCLGICLAVLIGIILSGGAKRVGKAAELLVPFMSVLFIAITLVVLICHAQNLLPVLSGIIRSAFSPGAAGGAAGGIALKETIHWGIRRSAFSNEAGLGSAGIAHAPVNTSHPEEHSLWGIFEVFADTIVLCTLTALVILCSGISIPWGITPGPELLQCAFSTVFSRRISAVFMAASMSLFAFATVIGWSLYGLQCIHGLFGKKAERIYCGIFVCFTAIGCVMSTDIVWLVSDTANALMSVPNFIALFLLSGQISVGCNSFFLDGENL